MAFINLLADANLWRDDLFDDDEPRLVCECRFEILRADGPVTVTAPVLELADTLRGCLERTLNTGAAATEFLWDSGERVAIQSSGDSMVAIEFPVGAGAILMQRSELTDFIIDCYRRGVSAYTFFPGTVPDVS